MNYEVGLAKNGEYTLMLNNINIYSKYKPRCDAEAFIQKEFDKNAAGYFLVGLGLGYHLEAILKLAGEKLVVVLPFSTKELTFARKYIANENILNASNIEIVNAHTLNKKVLDDMQFIIPLPWMKAIGISHPLYEFLEGIKERQMSYQSSALLMEQNFIQNLANKHIFSTSFKGQFKEKYACLIAAGPSLDETITTLEKIKDKFYILCVGAALKPLLAKQIKPNAVIVSDASPLTIEQMKNVGYEGMLFYLSTANSELINMHKGDKCILFQKGYNLSEAYAEQNHLDLFEVGGSVSTIGLSLLRYMEFETILLFGQDLGFKDNYTHSKLSPSYTAIASQYKYHKIVANSGEFINTRADWTVFRRWFEQEVIECNMNIYNTAWHGAKIANIPYISESEILSMYETLP